LFRATIDDDPFVVSIAGGEESSLGEWPWAAALGRPDSFNPHYFTTVCGGTLISALYVLTAAHCFPENPGRNQQITHVRLGDLDVHSNVDSGAMPQDIEICRVTRRVSKRSAGCESLFR